MTDVIQQRICSARSVAAYAVVAIWASLAVNDARGQDRDALPAKPDSIAQEDGVSAEDVAAYLDSLFSAANLNQVAVSDSLAGYDEQLEEQQQMNRVKPDTVFQTTEKAGNGVYRLEIDGLVVDETQTKLGRDFYDLFYRNWNAPPDAVNFTVTIMEQPTPNLGTRVIVRVNEEIAFQGQLQPRYDYIETVVQQAIYYTHRALSSRSLTTNGY